METLPETAGHTLYEESQAAQELTECLQQEQSQLVAVDVEALQQTTARKNVLVGRMTALAIQRHRALAAAGFPASEAGMLAWLGQTPAPATALKAAWQQLLAQAQQAREINRTNGMLITTHLMRTQAALNVLHQQPQRSGVYGPNGQPDFRTGGRTLVVG